MWTAFFKLGAGGITFEDKTLTEDLPDLPAVAPISEIQPFGTRIPLGQGTYYEKSVNWFSSSVSGVVRSSRKTVVELDAVADIDPWGGAYWMHLSAQSEQG